MIPVAVDGTVTDGAALRVGNTTLTAVATPGHIAGGTSWIWRSCAKSRCVTFAYIDSLTAVSVDGYRFTDHPKRIAPSRSTFARVRDLPCDVLVTPHPDLSNLFDRLAGSQPLIDRTACARLANASAERLDQRLQHEAGQ